MTSISIDWNQIGKTDAISLKMHISLCVRCMCSGLDAPMECIRTTINYYTRCQNKDAKLTLAVVLRQFEHIALFYRDRHVKYAYVRKFIANHHEIVGINIWRNKMKPHALTHTWTWKTETKATKKQEPLKMYNWIWLAKAVDTGIELSKPVEKLARKRANNKTLNANMQHIPSRMHG